MHFRFNNNTINIITLFIYQYIIILYIIIFKSYYYARTNTTLKANINYYF